MASRKNQVFTNAPESASVSQKIGMMPTTNVLKDDFGYEVPIERIPLPSGGLVYPPGHPLHGSDSINIRAMTAKEEDILMSRALAKQGTTLSTLISSCIEDKRIDPRDMISGDRLAVILGIRITGYGANYKVDVGCTSCGSASRQEFDIGDLAIKTLSLEPTSDSSRFEFLLPMSKKRVIFHFLTGAEEESLNAALERKQKLFPSAPEGAVTTKLEFHIDSIDGITDRNKISRFVSSMIAGDARALRSYIEENEPSVDLNVQWICTNCKAPNKGALPTGSLFFWSN